MTTDKQITWLTEQLNQVVAELIQAQEELRVTKAELRATQEELQTTKTELQSTQEALGAAQVQIAGLQKVKTPPPAFVKANKKKPQAKAEEATQKAGDAVQPRSEALGAHAHRGTPDRGVSGLSSALRRHQSGALP